MSPRTRRDRRAPSAPPAALQRIWAPWRNSYLRVAAAESKECIFCFGRLNAAERRRRLVLYDDRNALVMLNRYPYTGGHIMVAPRRHVGSPELLTREERAALGDLLAASVDQLSRTLHADGMNVGANLGRAAGAGFADHMHWHVVPRWHGDNNFMPVLASVRVVSQSLEDSYRQLRPVFKVVGAART